MHSRIYYFFTESVSTVHHTRKPCFITSFSTSPSRLFVVLHPPALHYFPPLHQTTISSLSLQVPSLSSPFPSNLHRLKKMQIFQSHSLIHSLSHTLHVNGATITASLTSSSSFTLSSSSVSHDCSSLYGGAIYILLEDKPSTFVIPSLTFFLLHLVFPSLSCGDDTIVMVGASEQV